MGERWDAYLAVALDGDDIEIQVDGHAGDIAQIAAMALAEPMSVKVTGVVAVPLLHILREFAATADLTGKPTRYPEGAAQFAARKEKEAHDSNRS